MGWMNDTLKYMRHDPVHGKYHHDELTFSLIYAFTENFVLPFSHDEVVHGKGSMIGRMPGDEWQKFATLRALYGYMFAHPGKKLLFMGNEIGQWREWNFASSLDWNLLENPPHGGLQHWVRDLNACLRSTPALHEVDFDPRGFEWVDCSDTHNSVISFLRRGRRPDDTVLVVCNFTPVVRHDYVVGAPFGGYWRERLNSDAQCYGGSGQGNLGGVDAAQVPAHGRPCSLHLTLPPLSMMAFERGARGGA
jgi:1,4-alpha-glucan branching enzyme